MATTALESCPTCPKCGARPAGEGRACPRCGLASDRMAAYAEKRDAAVPDALPAAWASVGAAWDDSRRHDALFQLIVQHGAYAWAAAQYRDRLRASPDDPIAIRQVERLRRAAEATLRATATARADTTPRPYHALLPVLVLLVFAVVAGLVFAVALRRNRPPSDATPASLPRSTIPGSTK